MSSRDVLRRFRTPGVSALGRQLGETPLGVWIIKHLVSPLDRLIYQLTGGRRVSTGRPLGPILLLTTTGRHTGKEHTTPLFYLRDNKRLIICNVNPGFERPDPWNEHNAQQSMKRPVASQMVPFGLWRLLPSPTGDSAEEQSR